MYLETISNEVKTIDSFSAFKGNFNAYQALTWPQNLPFLTKSCNENDEMKCHIIMESDYDNSRGHRHIHLLFYDTTKFDKVQTFGAHFLGCIISVKVTINFKIYKKHKINKIYKGNLGRIRETNKSRDEMNRSNQPWKPW